MGSVSRVHYCDCGKPARRKWPSGWVCDQCREMDLRRAKEERGAKLLALGLVRESKKNATQVPRAKPPNAGTHRREAAVGDVEIQTRAATAASRSVR